MGDTMDFEVRKAVARWCQAVAGEADTVEDHAVRKAIAKRMLEDVPPSPSSQALAAVVFLVRTFSAGGDGSTPEQIESAVAAVMGVFVKLGAFGGA